MAEKKKVQDVLNNKSFQGLSEPAKREVLTTRFPSFQTLSPLAQNEILRFKPPKTLTERVADVTSPIAGGMIHNVLEAPGEAIGFGKEVSSMARSVVGRHLTPEARAQLEKATEQHGAAQKRGGTYADIAAFTAPEAGGFRLAETAPLLARMGTEALTGAAIGGAQSDFRTAETIASGALAGAIPGLGALGEKLGQGVMHYLGFRTGAGAEVIKEALTNAGQDFKDAMAGDKVKDAQIATRVRDAYQRLVKRRGDEYRAELAKLPQLRLNTAREAGKNLLDSLSDWRIGWSRPPVRGPGGKLVKGPVRLDFSNSKFTTNPEAQQQIRTLVKTVDEWKDHTTLGVDQLKQAVDNLYKESSDARALIQNTKDGIRSDLNAKVKGYEKMTSGYARASQFLNVINKEFSLAMKSGEGPTVRKLIPYVFNQNNHFRADLIELLGHESGVDLKGVLAGRALSEALPRGLTGRLLAGRESLEAFGGSPLRAALLLTDLMASSPKMVGTVMSLLGRTSMRPGVQALGAAGGLALRGAGLATVPKFFGEQQPEEQQ